MTARIATIAAGALLAMLGALLITVQVASGQATDDQQVNETQASSSKAVKVPMHYEPPTKKGSSVSPRATLKTRRCGYLTYIIRDGGGSNYALVTYGFKSNSHRDYYQIRFTYDLRANKGARYPGWQRYWGGYHLFEVTKEMYWNHNRYVPKTNHRYYGTAVIKLYIVPEDGGGTCYGTVRGASGYIT